MTIKINLILLGLILLTVGSIIGASGIVIALKKDVGKGIKIILIGMVFTGLSSVVSFAAAMI